MVNGPLQLLHVFATFGTGGPQVRAVQLMQALGRRCAHRVLAMDGDTAAAGLLPAEVECTLLPRLKRGNVFGNVGRLASLLARAPVDLLLTYNWGAIEAVWAARVRGLRAVVHHEDGFLPDELHRRKWRRNLLRRVLLPGVRKVLVPSAVLHGIATREWGLRPQVLLHAPNGVDLQRFRRRSRPPNRVPVVGAVGGLRAEKDHAGLLQAVAAMRQPCRLLLVGDGPLRQRLQQQVAVLGLQERVEFAGALADPTAAYACMDVFVLSSRTEQMPLSLLEAMACSLPVAATDVGDVRAMLPAEGHGLLVPPEQPAALAAALDRLVGDAALRLQLGQANRQRCEAHYPLADCQQRFLQVYLDAAGCRGPVPD